ncbi:tRNA-dihydrouridine(16/17) synthase [NAD(P)(+)]-like [Geodia barretti]|uniref:tRNA-dihydrouridine(16/17) synthase [NAD(P)(+)]-like n=1 Tax=Geodia barretti TaxID=519541 RepID=A0AA35TCQ0_GEOBA|nr:tRNA-dihydrouridine(16/17) synthase [NAD(P)(+)]-like [Geodia barretti]
MAKKSGFDFWRSTLQGAKYVVAPMVDHSELAWRLLSRRYGAQLCYTPMLHAAVFERDANYRREHLVSIPDDRPLIVQFCANDLRTLLEAARLAQPHCEAIDLNLGCPQAIAKRGHYGAFLQDEWELLTDMIGLLHRELSVPVTCKIRVFEDVARTVRYAQMLEKAGCQLLTVHGRTRDQKGPKAGLASWEHIAAVKCSVNIPVFANGNIQFLRDAERCLLETGVNGVMTAGEGNLYNPAIFTGEQPPCWRMVEEYLALARTYTPPLSYIRGHVFKLWLHVLQRPEYLHFRERFGCARSIDAFEQISAELKALVMERLSEEELSGEFSLDDVPFWRCHSYVRPSPCDAPKAKQSSPNNESAGDSSNLTHKIKKRKQPQSSVAVEPKKRRWDICVACKGNPRGGKCEHMMCKSCCKSHCWQKSVCCSGHKFHIGPSRLKKEQGSEQGERDTSVNYDS